eukprot:COSAG02_NODE_7064_length_3201_cov_43.745003_1_plen_108_part_10
MHAAQLRATRATSVTLAACVVMELQHSNQYRPPAAKGTKIEQQGRLQRRMLCRRMSVVEGMSDGDAPLGAMLARAVDDMCKNETVPDLVPQARSEPATAAVPGPSIAP